MGVVALMALLAIFVRMLRRVDALAHARLLGLDLDGRGDLDGGASASAAEPFAHGLRQPGGEHAHVIGNLVAQAFLAAFGEDRLALYAKLFGKLIDSNTFSQIESPNLCTSDITKTHLF